MKILATLPTQYNNKFGAIVSLSEHELSLLVSGAPHLSTSGVEIGSNVDLCKRYHELARLEIAVANAEKVGSSLRLMANTIDAVVAAAKEAITPAEEVPTK